MFKYISQALVLLYNVSRTRKFLRVCFGTTHSPRREGGIGTICKCTIVLAPFVWLPYYTIILNIIILFLLSFGEEEEGCGDFYENAISSSEGMVCLFGETACLCLTPKISHRLWLFLSPQQTSLAQEFSPSRVTQTLSFVCAGRK